MIPMPAANKLTLNILCCVLYQLKCYVSFWMFHLRIIHLWRYCCRSFFPFFPSSPIYRFQHILSINAAHTSQKESFKFRRNLSVLTENINLAPMRLCRKKKFANCNCMYNEREITFFLWNIQIFEHMTTRFKSAEILRNSWYFWDELYLLWNKK